MCGVCGPRDDVTEKIFKGVPLFPRKPLACWALRKVFSGNMSPRMCSASSPDALKQLFFPTLKYRFCLVTVGFLRSVNQLNIFNIQMQKYAD